MKTTYTKAELYLGDELITTLGPDELKISFADTPAEPRHLGFTRSMISRRFVSDRGQTVITICDDLIDMASAKESVEKAGLRLISFQSSMDRPREYQIAIEDSPEGFEHTKETAARAILERVIELHREKKTKPDPAPSHIDLITIAKQRGRIGGGNSHQRRKRWRAILRHLLTKE